MALINCPECGKENVSDSAESCPNCGFGIKAHFLSIREAEIKAKEEAERQAAIKAAEEKRKVEEEEKKIKIQEQKKKQQEYWKINKVKIIVTATVVVLLIVGFSIFNKVYLKLSSACKKAQEYVDNGKYEDALNELVQVNGFGNSDEIYKAAMCGIADKNYKEAVSYMSNGELDIAYDILNGLNMDYVINPDEVKETLSLVAQYKDSKWNGSWENDGFSFIRYTNVIIKNGKAYIQFTQNNSSSIESEVEYPTGNSVYLDDVGLTSGNVTMVNENQIQVPYWSAPKGYYVWARIGSGAANEYESNYKSEPRIGMTHEQVEASTWGKPREINKTTYAWGTTEQWVYSGYRYIYFDNERVTAISE